MSKSEQQFAVYSLITIAIILYVLLRRQKKELLSHWNQLLLGMKYSSIDFYNLVEKELQTKQVPGISTAAVHINEGGMFSHTRLYMRIKWKDYVYDVCLAPFAEGSFVSWWIYTKPTLLERAMDYGLPFIGKPLYHKIFPITYYSEDTASMMMSYVQSSILAAVDSIVKDQGLRSLSEAERTPVVRDIFRRF